MTWRNLSECGERALIDGTARVCVRVTHHDGFHQDLSGQAWETDLETLTRLRARWGRRWHIVFTGHTWIASTHRTPGAHPRVETAPYPDRLEEQLEQAHPPGVTFVPLPRRPR